jgi:hypothetical protein
VGICMVHCTLNWSMCCLAMRQGELLLLLLLLQPALMRPLSLPAGLAAAHLPQGTAKSAAAWCCPPPGARQVSMARGPAWAAQVAAPRRAMSVHPMQCRACRPVGRGQGRNTN